MLKNLNDLEAFVTVAREGSFTKAAAQFGTSQSAVSHSVSALEARLGLRLLTRTTRNVSLTGTGQRLFDTVAPRFDDIARAVVSLGELRDRPAGIVRISASDHSANYVLWPKIAAFAPQFPDVKVELTVENGMIDIVAGRYDAGIRFGDQVAKDMIAVRIAPDLGMAVVGTPGYFAGRDLPSTPHDLIGHNCINLRLSTHGAIYAWEFQKDGHTLNVRVDGQLTFNSGTPMLRAALGGLGLASVPEDIAQPHIDSGALVRVLQDWAPKFPGYHIYYPNRRASPALAAFINAVRYRP